MADTIGHDVQLLRVLEQIELFESILRRYGAGQLPYCAWAVEHYENEVRVFRSIAESVERAREDTQWQTR
jgi:hypothetical protein